MKLLDTNVVNYARNKASPWHDWARLAIAEAGSTEGVGVNPVVLAELCAYAKPAGQLLRDLDAWDVQLLDLPAGAARLCGEAYDKYRTARKAQSQKDAAKVPLPDFFIGAHAEFKGWTVITNDPGRIKTYFPKVKLDQPPR